jgi:hypothetical protein
MKKILFLMILGLLCPSVSKAAPRKKGNRSATVAWHKRQAEAKIKAELARAVKDCFDGYDQSMMIAKAKRAEACQISFAFKSTPQFIEDALADYNSQLDEELAFRRKRVDEKMQLLTEAERAEVVAIERLAATLVPAAWQAYNSAPELPDHREYVLNLLSTYAQRVNFIPFNEQAQIAFNKVKAALLLLKNYTAPDDKKRITRFSQAYKFLEEVPRSQDQHIDELLCHTEKIIKRHAGKVAYALAQRAIHATDVESARSYLLSAGESGNQKAIDYLSRMQLPAYVLEEYERKALEGNVEAFELMSKYYLEQCKKEKDNESTIVRFLKLFQQTLDCWLANEKKDWRADLERSLPVLREMCPKDKGFELALITSCALLAIYSEKKNDYLGAQKFYDELLSMKPDHPRALEYANLFFSGKLGKGKTCWQKGITLLESSADSGNHAHAKILARMYLNDFEFNCGGFLHKNLEKARKYQQLADRHIHIAAGNAPNILKFCAIIQPQSHKDGNDLTELLWRACSLLATNKIEIGFEILESCCFLSILKTEEVKVAFVKAMGIPGLDQKLIQAQRSKDTKTALQALSTRSLYLGIQIETERNQTEKAKKLINMIALMMTAMRKTKQTSDTEGCFDEQNPDMYAHATNYFEELYADQINSFSVQDQSKLKQLYALYQKEQGETNSDKISNASVAACTDSKGEV